MTMSKSQIERLGVRLVRNSPPVADDLAALHELLLAYDDTLARAVELVRDDIGVKPTSRIKSTGTILEKLERYGGSWLKSIQDIAGMRIVGGFDRNGQDAMVADLVALFDTGGRRPKVIDRRAEPSHGYRAVHVVAFVDSIPVEIQVRTRLQHEWADLFEKLADRIGRGIRYGEPPDHLRVPDQVDRLAEPWREIYDRSYSSRLRILELALGAADVIAGFEEAERVRPSDPRLGAIREQLQARLQDVQTLLNLISELSSFYDELLARL